MAVLKSINPADDTENGQVLVTDVVQIPLCVQRARDTQIAWAQLGLAERKQHLVKAGQRMLDRADELAALITKEMGKPVKQARAEVVSCGTALSRELDEIASALESEVIDDGRTRSTVRYHPLGVCAVITPWNFPFSMPHWMIIPALMAGNTVVFKPSEQTPLVGQAYADILCEDLPAGVLNIIHGADEQGKVLVGSDVDLVAFTGSRAVGKAILSEAARGLKRVILELGGKDPLIVLDGADLPGAARFAARNSFSNAGQVCVSTERIYVLDSMADEFVSYLVAEADSMIVGNGLDLKTQIGPLVTRTQRTHVNRQVRQAVQKGARLVTGGHLSEHGSFMTPAVLDRVDHGMDIAIEETFGPVACVIRVSSVDDAVRLANDSEFGLGAIVFGPEKEARAVAVRLNAGMVGVNRGVGGAQGTPWVGARQSGYGYHKSIAGHRQFAQIRVISEPQPRTSE